MTKQNEQYDVVLANGRVIDPETYRDGTFNVGINGGQIAAISDQPLKGKEVIDVSGMIVSPGFIDTHSHGMTIPDGRISAFDGLTTVLELEAGVLPVGEFYDNCAKEGRPINYGVSSGWGFARLVAMNPEEAVNGKPVPTLEYIFSRVGLHDWVENIATEKEIEEIMERTEQGLKEGGLGIGVIHGYAPGAGYKELLKVWKLAKQYNMPTYTHIQNLSMAEPNSGTKDMIALMGLAASTGAHTHVCHWNSTSLRDIGIISELVRTAQKQGLPITTEAYSYGAGSSAVGAIEFNPSDIEQRLSIHFEDLSKVVGGHKFTSEAEFAAERAKNPGESVVVHFLNEDDNAGDASLLDMSVLFPGTAICTDGVQWVTSDGKWFYGKDWPLPEGLQSHPRHSGGFSRFLRKWVRVRGVLSWMDAIRQTSLNACLILEESVPQMKKKGRLQEGMDADIIVFNPETVSENGTFAKPCVLATGMKHVIVNGNFLIRDEKLDTKAMPGQPIRGPIRD